MIDARGDTGGYILYIAGPGIVSGNVCINFFSHLLRKEKSAFKFKGLKLSYLKINCPRNRLRMIFSGREIHKLNWQ